ncbi:hypothetical protein J6TS2_07380 [Heyndrickxia sporothermodurans]|nr:hypothetical protein J6TS2_07380 [Heyndrickxia sporothermodurans]
MAASSDLKVTPDSLIAQLLIDYPEKTLPKKFILPLSITSINDIKGKWDFNIPIRQLPNKKINVTQSITSKDKKVTLQFESITFGKESSVFDYKAIHSIDGKNDLMRLSKIIDDKGQEIPLLMSGMEFNKKQVGNKIESEERSIYGKIPADAKYITFYPYVRRADTNSIKPLNTPTPFTLKSKRSNTQVTVKNIQYKKKEQRLVVQFKVDHASNKKSVDELARNFIGLIGLVDSSMSDREYYPLGHILKDNDVEILDEKNLLFESTFKLDGEQFGTFNTALENFSLEGYSFEIPFSTSLPEKPLPPIKVKLK